MPRVAAPPASARVLLVGRPNVGKSVLFHALTGRYATVSNYAGTTLELRGARVGEGLEILDTPGLLSLAARTDDEAVTRDELIGRPPDCVVHVVNARELASSLVMTFELARLGVPMVLVLNLCDEALARGRKVDARQLSSLLGIPVVPTVAVRGEGVAELKGLLPSGGRAAAPPPLPAELERAAAACADALGGPRWALLALTGDDHARRLLVEGGAASEEAMARVGRVRARFSRNPSFLFLNAARDRAQELAARVSARGEARLGALARLLDALGRWSLRPVSGAVLACAVLWGLYQFVGVFGAQTAVEFLEDGVFGRWLNPAVSAWVARLSPWAWLTDVLVGPYGVFTMALTYAFALVLPIVTTFFLAFSVLEDSGYFPRFSVVTDRFFRLIGLNGKAVLPMLLGLGCGTMAIVTTRVLETRRERLLVSFLLSLTVPCSAQLGVVLGIAGGADPRVLWTWLAVVAATFFGVGWASSRAIPGAVAPFAVEIPPMRLPQPANVLRKVAGRLKWYLREVVPMFVYGTLLLFVLDRTGGLAWLEARATPLIQGLLGLPGQATGAFLMGFLRRDYGAAGLFQLHRDGLLDPRQAAVSLVCITLFMPCFAQWMVTLREQGWKVTALITGFVFAYALGAAALVNRLWGVL